MISIIIPTLNEEKYIGVLLDSIIDQDFDEDIEVVIADADSTDRTREVAEGYKNRFKNLLIVGGGMPAVSRNNGAKASSGDPIFFIDADMTLIGNDCLKKATDLFRRKKLGIAPTYLKPDSQSRIDNIMTRIYNLWLPISKYLRPSGSMCIIASREMFNISGGYPEDVIMNEDHDFVYKCSKLGHFGVIPVYLKYSMRRFAKEGRWHLFGKYTLSVLHVIFVGPIRKPIFKYEFGNYKEKNDKAEQSK